MSDHGSEDESSGFGDFCGFNLEEDLSEGGSDDELERPGKTYEYVNFVDPKYAEKRRSKSSSYNSSSKSSAYFQNNSDNEEKDHIHETDASQSYLLNTQTDYHNSNQSRLISQTPARNSVIPEDEENNPDYYYTHDHDISLHDYIALTRTNTESEIAAEHGSVRTSVYLKDGRRKIINSRRNQRRYVWKDADLFDIICVIASPCVKPSEQQFKVPSCNQLIQSQSNSYDNKQSVAADIHTADAHSIDIDNGVFACVDDEQNVKKRRQTVLTAKTTKTRNMKKKKKKNRNRAKTSNKSRNIATPNTAVDIHAASDTELMRQKSPPYNAMMRNQSINSVSSENSNAFGDRDIVHHFDMKGIQTLLYDGILCSIHQTARFSTLCGNIENITCNIGGCKLLHYIGYAANGKLLLESDNDLGLGKWFDPLTIEPPIIDNMTQCVVIQSPTHMEVADIFLKLKVKHVIAIKQTQYDIYDFAYTRFLTQFYFALIESNTTIARAFRSALNLFEGLKYMDSIITDFRLLPEDEDHELILFRNGLFDAGKPVNYSEKLPPQNNLHAIRPFLGRWNDVYKVMNMIRDKKLSIVCSANEGCGRTSIIVMAARYLWERGQFKGGVLHIKNNVNTNMIKNLADLILHTLSVSGVDGFEAIADLYNEQYDKYSNKSQLAVELLYEYVFGNQGADDSSTPICLLFSDFDVIPFPPAAKYAFICALIERFDEEIEMQGDIGTRIVITCRVAMVSQLQYFMDHVYTSYQQTHSDPFYAASHNEYTINYDSNYYKLPMQYKRGHQVIKCLHENDLIELFLQMIHIASTDARIYNFNHIKSHKALLALFDHQPFKVKQISEYVLQTFDDNLSRQQFQYEEFAEADYGLIYEFGDDASDISESEEDEEPQERPQLYHKYITSINTINTSRLELKMDQISDYNPSPRISTDTKRISNDTKRISTGSEASLKSHKMQNPSNLSLGLSADFSNIKTRRSKLVKVISIKTIKLQDSKSFKQQRNSLKQRNSSTTANNNNNNNNNVMPLTPANTPENTTASYTNMSYQNVLEDRISISVDGTASFMHNISNPVISNAMDYECMDLLPTIPSIRATSSADMLDDDETVINTDQSYKYLPAAAITSTAHLLVPSMSRTVVHDPVQSTQSLNGLQAAPQSSKHDLLLESTIVPSDDCHILLTKSTSNAKMKTIDMAITPMDYKRTFIREKVHFLIHNKPQKLHENKSMDLLHGGFPSTNSFAELPRITGMSTIPSGLSPFLSTPADHDVSTAGHKPKNVSFSHHDNNQHAKDLSTKFSRLKLTLTGESIPIGQRHSGGAAATPELNIEEAELEEVKESVSIDDKIAAAWPSLDEIVSGFTKLEQERRSRKEMDYRKSLIFTHSNAHPLIQQQQQQVMQQQLLPQTLPPQIDREGSQQQQQQQQHQQRRFKDMDASDSRSSELDGNSPRAIMEQKPLNINISKPSIATQLKQAVPIMPPLSGMIHNAISYEESIDTATEVIQNDRARQIWHDAGGFEADALGLDDLMLDFYNYFTTKTKIEYLRIDEQSFGPLLKQFDPKLHITAGVFNKVWKWFDSICDIVNETYTFWNNKFASNHGFITSENAEKELIKSTQGTFIIRFAAPNPNVIVTYNDPNKQYSNNPITHITFVRKDNTDSYENMSMSHNNRVKNKLKIWIQKMSEFQYIYNKDHFTKKEKYFW